MWRSHQQLFHASYTQIYKVTFLYISMKISITFFSISLIFKHNNSVLPFPRKLFIQLDLEFQPFQQFPHSPWFITSHYPLWSPSPFLPSYFPLRPFLDLLEVCCCVWAGWEDAAWIRVFSFGILSHITSSTALPDKINNI